MLPQFLKDGRENGNFMFVFGALGLVVIRRTADRQDPALFADRELRMIRLYNFGSVPYWTFPVSEDNKLSLSQTEGGREYGRKAKDVSRGAEA